MASVLIFNDVFDKFHKCYTIDDDTRNQDRGYNHSGF